MVPKSGQQGPGVFTHCQPFMMKPGTTSEICDNWPGVWPFEKRVAHRVTEMQCIPATGLPLLCSSRAALVGLPGDSQGFPENLVKRGFYSQILCCPDQGSQTEIKWSPSVVHDRRESTTGEVQQGQSVTPPGHRMVPAFSLSSSPPDRTCPGHPELTRGCLRVERV